MGTKCILVSSVVNVKCKYFDKNRNNLLVSGFTISEITSLKTLDIARPSDKPIATLTGSCTSKNFRRFKKAGDIFSNNCSVLFNALLIVLLKANIIFFEENSLILSSTTTTTIFCTSCTSKFRHELEFLWLVNKYTCILGVH